MNISPVCAVRNIGVWLGVHMAIEQSIVVAVFVFILFSIDLPVLSRTELQAKAGSPSEEELIQLAEKIAPSWRKLGRALGLEEHKLHAIDADYKSVYEKSCQMLLVWKKMNGSQASYSWLVQALQFIGSHILAEEYCADKVKGTVQPILKQYLFLNTCFCC